MTMRDDEQVSIEPIALDPAPIAPTTIEQPVPAAPVRRRPRRLGLIVLGLVLLLFTWLAVTAPLYKSLQPVAAPSITLLSAEGQPIARRGATIEAPVDVTKLPPYVGRAFVAIEDRR